MSASDNSTSTAQISDGYHTFGELYEHRGLLFVALMRARPELAWRARRHEDGTGEDCWWIGGMKLPSGEITYHLPSNLWALLDGSQVETRERAPAWDGHSSAEVLRRLRTWLSGGDSPPSP